jgi:hypothetical protein
MIVGDRGEFYAQMLLRTTNNRPLPAARASAGAGRAVSMRWCRGSSRSGRTWSRQSGRTWSRQSSRRRSSLPSAARRACPGRGAGPAVVEERRDRRTHGRLATAAGEHIAAGEPFPVERLARQPLVGLAEASRRGPRHEGADSFRNTRDGQRRSPFCHVLQRAQPSRGPVRRSSAVP